ncbi:MAG: paraquat-inducible protein A [Candidatus Scalindua sp.]
METPKLTTVIIITIISLALLIPGVTQPMLTLTGTIDKAKMTETGIDIIIDSMVEKSMKRGKDKSEKDERGKATRMIGMVTAMLGLNSIEGEIEAYSKTRSIKGTVKDLFRTGNGFVGFLVMLFSIVIPVAKILLMLLGAFFRDSKHSRKAFLISSVISKWSMADVFVIAIIVAFMAANASNMGGLLNLGARFEFGFYFFLGYCIFSILSMQFITRKNKNLNCSGLEVRSLELEVGS